MAEITLLQRQLGLFGAVVLGLASIVGTGVFISLGLAAGLAGPGVLIAIALAAGVAGCNGLSSAQLAANYPVSGGTYEYGYRLLNPWLGFLAGWMFLCAKTASAATAALGFAGYLSATLSISSELLRAGVAVGVVMALTAVVACGIKQSAWASAAMVGVTIAALLALVVAALPTAIEQGPATLTRLVPGKWSGLLEAAALLFVAYTGYGRIATLGEEVHEPRTTIPRAIVITLLVAMALYLAVGVTALTVVGADELGRAAESRGAPLEVVAERLALPWLSAAIGVGAMTAMLGVLLNLIAGLSRVVLAMARRSDMPGVLATLNNSRTAPIYATLLVGLVVAGLTLLGDVKATWTFSALTVLVYYAVTNLAALRLTREQRLFPSAIAWMGLAACLFLTVWIPGPTWLVGLGIAGFGLVWRLAAIRLARPQV